MPATPSRRAFRYALTLVLLQAAITLACFYAVTLPWFLDREMPPYFRTVGFAQRAAGMNCQVVAYGDSTGLSDFIPAEIEARTGLKTCNVSEFRSIQDLTGIAYPLDAYLAHNPPPRFIVGGFTPHNFGLDHPPLLSLNFGDVAYAIRFHPGPWLWKAMLRHPSHTVEFLASTEHTIAADALFPSTNPAPTPGDDRSRRDRDLGYWSIGKPPETHCTGATNTYLDSSLAQNQAAAAWFRARYSTAGTTVLLLTTPVADCDPGLASMLQRTKGLADAPLDILPVSAFNDQDVHLDRPAAVVFSREVANLILARMAEHPTP